MNTFSFNPSRHNFWPLYETIKTYYPLGVGRGDSGSIYFNYPGIKKLDAVILEMIHDSNNFNSHWVSFEKEISNRFNIEVIGTTYGKGPSFSCDIILERVENEQLVRIKKISLAVSLAGKFFTIYGVDETMVIEKKENASDYHFHAFNALTVSPYKEFESLFKGLKEIAKTEFTEFKFVPFAICSMVIPELQVRYLDKEECTVFNALFNHLLDSYDYRKIPRGDRYYGYDDWLSENYNPKNDIGITLTPPDSIE